MSQRWKDKIQRAALSYANYFRFLMEYPSAAPIHLWNDYQPKVLDAVNLKLIDQMRRDILPAFQGARGICVGGSLRWRFKEYLKQAAQVVNVDLVAEYPGGSVVPDYVTSASNLYFARDGEFDFVCSSHVLEHLSNPILALREWMRVIKYDGIVYCGVPDKRFTFDHKRKRTALQHLVKDYKQNVSTEDLTHLYDFYFNYDYRLARINRETVLKQVLDYYSSTKMGKLLCFSFTIMFS